MITKLGPYEVFVFGSNGQGFHGAGTAGYAFRGTSDNTWRDDPFFLKAMKAPAHSPDRIGKWAIFGVVRGFMRGREGCSYAIQTVTRPGARRSIPLYEIREQLIELCKFATTNPEWTFLIGNIGEGYAGYSKGEMDSVWGSISLPPNVKRDHQ